MSVLYMWHRLNIIRCLCCTCDTDWILLDVCCTCDTDWILLDDCVVHVTQIEYYLMSVLYKWHRLNIIRCLCCTCDSDWILLDVCAVLVVNTSRSFPHSWLVTGFVIRITRRVSIVEQELPTLPEHMSSSPVISGVRVTRSLV